MTSSDVLEIGDKVVFNVHADTRHWTNIYDDIPNGTPAVVCGFHDSWDFRSHYEPDTGVYYVRGVASVMLADGRIIDGGYVELADKAEEDRRRVALRAVHPRGWAERQGVRLGDLPETKFWEGDVADVMWGGSLQRGMAVVSINYHDMHNTRNDGSPYPFYTVRFADGSGMTGAEEADMTLVERGNLWKYHHGEPLVFADLHDEADFFKKIGQAEEVPNPKTDLYNWTLDEALAAIDAGIIHCFSMGSGLFGASPRICAYKFHDEELGLRLAFETLEGFESATV